MAGYQPMNDITHSNAKLLEEVDPELVVLNVDHTKSYMPMAGSASKAAAAAAKDEMLKKKLSLHFGEELLETSGWGSGTRLPFANKENQELEKILEIRQRKYLSIQTELRDNVDHLQMLNENFTRANEDISSHHNFLASKKKQIDEERNLQGLAERFYSKVVQEKQKTEKDLKSCKDRCDRMQGNHDRRLKNLCELRDLIEFDREALKDYHERLKNYQNQKFEIGRIIEEDSKTVEQIDKMYVELGARRKILKMELDQQAMTTQKCQEQLDRLSVEFRKVYRHRQEMITLWSTNIENAKRKDVQMQDIADDYFDTRERIRDLKNEMDFRERLYKAAQCSIRNTQFHLAELDKKLAEFRRILQKEKDAGISLRDGIMEIQQDIRASSVEERNLLARSARLDSEMSELVGKLEKVRSVVQKFRNKLADVSGLRHTSDNYINELEKILMEELKRSDVVLRDIELQRKYFWERSNDKKTIKNDIAHYEMAVLRLKYNFSNLEAKELANMEFLAKQSAKVYRMDLECSTLENKISHIENETINPQYYTIQTEVTELRNDGRKLNEDKKYISQNLSYLELLISKNGVELAKNRDEKDKLSMELLQINMVSQRTQKLMDGADKEFQDKQVENSLEVVNLKRLTDAVKAARNQLFGLAEQRKTIHYAVNERKTEIENNRALNQSKIKAITEAVNKLKVQIQEMMSRTDKLRGRFDLITKMMTNSKNAGTEEESIAYKLRMTARQRENLQLELRKWEKSVEEAKHELLGLENVQKMLLASNFAVKEKLTPIAEGSPEAEELELLDQEEKAIHVRKSRALRFKAILVDKIEELKQQMAVMEQETEATDQLCKMKAAMASRTENELMKQKEKMQRWNVRNGRLLKDLKSSENKLDYDVIQQDLKLRLIQEKMECAFTMLEKLLHSFPRYKEKVLKFFQENQYLVHLTYRLTKTTKSGFLKHSSRQQLLKVPTTAGGTDEGSARKSTTSSNGTGDARERQFDDDYNISSNYERTSISEIAGERIGSFGYNESVSDPGSMSSMPQPRTPLHSLRTPSSSN